jgi:hypothetical protein
LCYHGNYYTSLNFVTTALGRRSNPSDIFVSYWYAALMEIPIWILPFFLQSHLKVYQVVLTVSLICAAILSICYAILPTGKSKTWNPKCKYTICVTPWYRIFFRQSVIKLFERFPRFTVVTTGTCSDPYAHDQ